MEISNLKNNIIQDQNLNIEQEQKSFLETAIGQVISKWLDIGLKILLPDFIDEQVINLKNNLFENGIKDGIRKTLDDTIELGKSVTGIFTGKFENIEQIQNVIKSGGILDGFSSLFDSAIKLNLYKGKVNSNIANVLLQGKNVIVKNVEENLEKELNKQANKMNSLEGYINNWKKDFNDKNFEKMEKEYKKIKKELKELIPLEEKIKEAKNIELLHNLIKNNGKNFDVSEEQRELIKKLA